MINDPHGITITVARQVIEADYAANEPSSTLIYAARRMAAEVPVDVDSLIERYGAARAKLNRVEAELAALREVALEIVELNDTGYDRMVRLRAALGLPATSNPPTGCAVSPDDPQSAPTSREDTMPG